MEQRAVTLRRATARGTGFDLYVPAREAWNGRLALVGCEPSPAGASGAWPALEAECLALRRRGYACAPLGADGEVAAEVVAAARLALRRAHGAAPRQVFAFAFGAPASAALELASRHPADCNAVVAIGAPPAALASDLQAFARAGGRLVVAHGSADAVVPAAAVVRGFEALERNAGGAVAASGFARLFLWVGLDRALRGDAPGEVDWALQLERWCDRVPSRPPDDPTAIQRAPGVRVATSLFAPTECDPADVVASRPCFPFPLRTLYKGRGDPCHWSSWYAPAIYRRDLAPPRPDELPVPLSQDPARRQLLAPDTSIGTVAVIGASGRLGLAILAALAAMRVPARAIARDPARLAQLDPTGTPAIAADVRDAAALSAALAGTRCAVFAASATAGGDGDNTPQAVEYQGLVNTVAAARRHGLRRVLLVSSSAATQPGHVHNLWGGILEWKARAEQHLRDSGLDYVVLRPMGLRAGDAGQRGIRFAQGDRMAFGEEIRRDDVALLCVAALADPAASRRSFEAYNDDTLPPGSWVGSFAALRAD